MLDTLFKVLRWDIASPEIRLDEDGYLSLDYSEYDASVSILPDGKVSWAVLDVGHGTDIDQLRVLLQEGPSGKRNG